MHFQFFTTNEPVGDVEIQHKFEDTLQDSQLCKRGEINAESLLPDYSFVSQQMNLEHAVSDSSETHLQLSHNGYPYSVEFGNAVFAEEYAVIDGLICSRDGLAKIPDAPIDKLNFSVRVYYCLARYGIQSVSQLIGMPYSKLSSVCNLVSRSLLEVIEKLNEYLIHPENGIQAEKQDEESILAEEYNVEEGLICCRDGLRKVPDASIEKLNLSVRAYSCLVRFGIRSISQLIGMPYSRLSSVRNLGSKSQLEIIEKLDKYLRHPEISMQAEELDEEAVLAKEYTVEEGHICSRDGSRKVPDASIIILNLSVRASNCLFRSEIRSVSQLIGVPLSELESIRNLGIKTAHEIASQLDKYLNNANQSEQVEAQGDDPETEKPLIALPPLPERGSILAPEYAVVGGVIYNRTDMEVIPDIYVDMFDLTVNTTNCLFSAGIGFISQLVGMPFQRLRRIPKLGFKSASEINEKLDRYLKREHLCPINHALKASLVSLKDIQQVLRQQKFKLLTVDDYMVLLPGASAEVITTWLERLVQTGKVGVMDSKYYLIYQSFFSMLGIDSDDLGIDKRDMRVIKARMEGKTFEEIGSYEGISRERVRQIEKNAIIKLTCFGGGVFAEDEYAYFYQTYLVNREFFSSPLFPENLWYYLGTRYKIGDKSISFAVEDKLLAQDLRRLAERWLYRDYFQVDDEYVPLQRSAIEDIVLKKCCQDEKTLEDFFALYTEFLEQYGLENNSKLIISDSVMATRMNRLAESRNLLWKQNRRLRYYNVSGKDYFDLLDTLNLGQYTNIELSTRKFLLDYPDLMRQYDIRDEYELHNLLKKIGAEKDNPMMAFSRMPSIQFGDFDRTAAVKEVLFALAPVSLDDLAQMLSFEYGHRVETIKANWLTSIDQYYYQGFYSVQYAEMPDEHKHLLESALSEDFYYLGEIKKIYVNLMPDADISLISTYNLKRMGFQVFASYAIRNFATADEYFSHLLLDGDIVDVALLMIRYGGVSAFGSCLANLKHKYDIIEFEPGQFINLRRLEAHGISRAFLKEYCNQVWSFEIEDSYFSIKSLKKAGLITSLDDLGFDNLFYCSLLKEDERFSWQRIGGTVIFCTCANSFTARDFIVEVVTVLGSINIVELSEKLRTEYGIILDSQSIIEKAKGSELHYDSIMEKLYATYSIYFEEI